LVIDHPWTDENDVGMVYAKNSCISKGTKCRRAIVALARFFKNHDIAMGGRPVHSILRAPNVICCIVDTEEVMAIQAIVFEDDRVDIAVVFIW